MRVLFASLLFLSACTTPMKINTGTEDAKILVDGAHVGNGSVTLNEKPGYIRTYNIEARSKNGCEKTVSVQSKQEQKYVVGCMVGSILGGAAGGAIGASAGGGNVGTGAGFGVVLGALIGLVCLPTGYVAPPEIELDVSSCRPDAKLTAEEIEFYQKIKNNSQKLEKINKNKKQP